MSAHEQRTSLDVNKSKSRWKKAILAYFIGPRWTLLGVDGHLIWWARQDSNLQPDRYEWPGQRDLVVSPRINLLSRFRRRFMTLGLLTPY